MALEGIKSEESFGKDGSLNQTPLKERCCSQDTDHDGNCPKHSAPGVLRNSAMQEDTKDGI